MSACACKKVTRIAENTADCCCSSLLGFKSANDFFLRAMPGQTKYRKVQHIDGNDSIKKLQTKGRGERLRFLMEIKCIWWGQADSYTLLPNTERTGCPGHRRRLGHALLPSTWHLFAGKAALPWCCLSCWLEPEQSPTRPPYLMRMKQISFTSFIDRSFLSRCYFFFPVRSKSGQYGCTFLF